MPGPVIKGFGGATRVSLSPAYDSENGLYAVEEEYQGPEAAILGLQNQFIADGLSFRTSNQGPVFSIYVRTPLQTVDENLDRWEIFTESTEKSLFELPDAVAEADTYDAGLATDEKTFREECEDSVRKNSGFQVAAIGGTIIRHLRAGVTGWQLDLVGIRRTRKVKTSEANATFRLTLDTGLFVYSQAQLNLPALVAFSVPATPTDTSDLFTWGWRKRSQRVEIVGNYSEQTVELLLAPWSTLAYFPATAGLEW